MTSCVFGQVSTRARTSILSRVGAPGGGFGMSKAEWNVSVTLVTPCSSQLQSPAASKLIIW